LTAHPAAIEALRADPEMAPLHRSLDAYYGDPARDAAMDALHARFVRAGDLAFDIGSHVGDRIGSFRRLGARVVAVEPQPLCMAAIRFLYARDDQVTLLQAACGARTGTVTVHVNSANPTVSTVSPDFVQAADGATGWEDQVWDERIETALTTLDALISAYGMPAFTKIDVEGYEDAVLAGLSWPLPALSFEFTTIEREVAVRCLDRLATLGRQVRRLRSGPAVRSGPGQGGVYGFDVALAEGGPLVFGRWVSAAELADYLLRLPHSANSGDVYCRLLPPGQPELPQRADAVPE
jgi:FkbM family methyltransferase